MFVYPQIETVFVSIPKTATRSISVFLKKKYSVVKLANHQAIIPDKYKNYFSFIVIRNPYERICSLYWSMCRRSNSQRYPYVKIFKERAWDNSLENFLKILQEQNQRKRHQFAQYKYFEHNDISQIIRYESLQEDFNKMSFVEDNAELPRNNSTTKDRTTATLERRPFWKNMVTSEEGKMINEMFKEDFELLDYKMEKFE